MNSSIYVGATKETVKAAQELIMGILESGAEQKTIRVALETVKDICNVNNTSISNCTFTQGENNDRRS